MQDDFKREGLGIEVGFYLPDRSIIGRLDRIIKLRSKPGTIRVDTQGSEPDPGIISPKLSPEYISCTLLT